MRKLSFVTAGLGLVGATLLIGWFGFGPVASTVLSVGPAGFAMFCAWQVVTMAELGLSWRLVAPLGRPGRTLPFVWGRIVRDSAGSCLPFSIVGGFVFGIRAAALHGIPWSLATLSLVVDLTAEFVAELIFAAAGLVLLLTRNADPSLAGPILFGIAGAIAIGIAVLWLQRGAVPLLVRFGRRILGDWFADRGEAEVAQSSRELARLYGHGGRTALGIAAHLVGWFCKGVGNWLAFRLLGADIDLPTGLAIEALLHALLIPAVIVPGFAGVQEAGYAGIGALFGIPPEIALGVSLLRRARDIAIGMPVLLVWQFVEMRRLRRPGLAERLDGQVSAPGEVP